ncbi:hypothetical protein D3C74_151240 [compost metagenome]
MTLNFDSLRTNKKRGEDARNRVMQRVYGSGVNGTEEQTGERGVLNFDVLRNRPITDEKGLGKPMAELQQSFGAVTPLNLMNAAVYDSVVKQQKEQLSQPKQTQYAKNIEKINQGNEPEFVKGISRGGEWLFHGNPVGRFISNSLPSDPMAYQRDSTGSKVADTVSDVLYSITSPLLTPTGAPIGSGPIAGTYDVAGKMLSSPAGLKVEQAAANQLSKLFSPKTSQAIANEALREGIAGSMQGTAYGLMSNHDDGELLNDALLGGGLGFGAGALFKGAGLGISKLLSKNGIPESEIAEILALPEGKLDSRMSSAAERSVLQAGTDPIVNPYQFDLPEATPATRAAAANASEGHTALQQIDNALNDLNTKYEQVVIDEYKVLKEVRDSNGSKPEWYKQFYRENKKRPSNKDLYKLARERTDGGYRVESGYDNQLEGLMSTRGTLQNSLREIDPSLRVVDQPIISQELRDTRVTPSGNRSSSAPYEPVQPGTSQLDTRRQEINDRLAAGGNLTSDDIDYILSRGIPDTPKIEQVTPKQLPEVDPNASPILRPGQFEDQSGLGISAFSKTKPYDSLRTDTRSQLMSRQYKEPRGLTANADRLYTSLVDDLHPLNRQDQILDEVMGEKIPSSQRIHDLGLASRGADVVAKRIITDGLVDAEGKVVGESLKSILSPMKQLMRKNKHIYVDFEDYLLNKHAITRFERGEKVFRDELNWSPTYGSQKVSEYERMFPQFKEMSDKLYEFQNKMAQKWLVDTGMIPQEMLDAWKQQNPYYVPNKRYFSELEKTGKGFGGNKRGFGNQSNPVKSYQKGGSQRKIISPIEAMIENVDAYVKSAKRNQVMQQYVKNIELAPDDFEPWAEIVKQLEKPDDIAKIIMDEGGLDELLFRFSADFDKAMQRTQLDKDNIVRAMMDGEAVHVKIKDKQLLSALTALGPAQSGFLLNVVGKLTGTLKLLTTGSNPVFSLTRNLFRDIPQAYIASKTRDNPIAFASDLISAAMDIGLNRQAYRDFLNSGGGHASAIASDRNLLAQSKRSVLPQSGAKRMLFGVKDGYENLLNAVELAPRLSEFKRVKAGDDDLHAALMAAQDLTVNFKRRGALSGEVDKVFPYFNAAMQGLDKTVRTYRDDPVKALVKSVLAITIPTMALYAENHDDPNYKKVSNRTKDAFLLIPRGDGKFIKIAKPQEQGTVFSDIPERLMRRFYEQDPAAFRDFADRVRTTFIPPGIQGMTGKRGVIGGLLGDTILGPGVDVVANEAWSGAPVVPGYLQDLSPGLQADANTTLPARKLGELTYGTPFEVSPKKLDYLARQYTGFLGQFGQPMLSSGGDVGYALSQQMTADPVFSNDLSTEFYHYKSKLDQAYNDRELKQVPKWYSDPLRKRLNKLSQNMSAVRKEIRTVQGDSNLSNAEKREKLRELQERINRIAESGNNLAREVVPY